MRISICLSSLLLACMACTSAQAQIYKCKEADGSLLYTDAPCEVTNAKTMGYMPRGSTYFAPVGQPDTADADSDAAIQNALTMLSAEEANLSKYLDDVQAAPGESLAEMPMAHAQRLELMGRLEEVRRKKSVLLGRGLSSEDKEELVDESETPFRAGVHY